MNTVIPAPVAAVIPVAGSDAVFPVRRIYCIGRNYADHAREMGADPGREPPFYFMKPADAVRPSGARLPFPGQTARLDHEIELVAAIGTGGSDIAVEDALAHVWGYAVGIDMTRRDLQSAAKAKGHPWEPAKGFDASAPVSALHATADIGHPARARIWLTVNGEPRQTDDIADMTWSLAEVIAHLSKLNRLEPGDLIFTGTPAGVGPVKPGDLIEGGVDGVDTVSVTYGG
ncbi:fumarylacetoacetate hydrolase family protein [Derxia gummosa]|uniref:Fumarylacetoacetate hydrolase family protein n=1 Tax=Derxia gummosa DSM 723 TaxID=1121388 RepID=A0A8B6X6Z4_9BURK|nr:fumarylacetoacetate hydrolase family protein [Derxia gummosa]